MANNTSRRVAVLGGNRIPFARSDSAFANASNQDMFTAALGGLIDRFNLDGEKLGAVIGGAVLKHSRDFNLMRECVLGSSLSSYTPAFDIQQACGTGLQATIAAADGVAAGRYDVAAAGGVDTASDAPIAFGDDLRRVLLGLRRSKSNVDRLKLVGKLPASLGVEIPVNSEPRTGLSMGEHAAIMAKEWGIGREEQDELAVASHRNLAAALDRYLTSPSFSQVAVCRYAPRTHDHRRPCWPEAGWRGRVRRGAGRLPRPFPLPNHRDARLGSWGGPLRHRHVGRVHAPDYGGPARRLYSGAGVRIRRRGKSTGR